MLLLPWQPSTNKSAGKLADALLLSLQELKEARRSFQELQQQHTALLDAYNDVRIVLAPFCTVSTVWHQIALRLICVKTPDGAVGLCKLLCLCMQSVAQASKLQRIYEQICREKTSFAEKRTQLDKRVADLVLQMAAQTAAADALLGEQQRALDEAEALRSALSDAHLLARSSAERCCPCEVHHIGPTESITARCGLPRSTNSCMYREACLMEEKMQLKAGLASALENQRGLESGLQAASEELVDLQIRVTAHAASLPEQVVMCSTGLRN